MQAGRYGGIGDCFVSIARDEGVTALYRGLLASALGIIPYALPHSHHSLPPLTHERTHTLTHSLAHSSAHSLTQVRRHQLLHVRRAQEGTT